jgi:glycosyltransferase involved in cell wall biosynthesis
MTSFLPVELSWPIAGNTGWGLYGLHIALGLTSSGRSVSVPSGSDPTGISPPLKGILTRMAHAVEGPRIRLEPWGNHYANPNATPGPGQPGVKRVCLAVFEDPAAVRADLLRQYDLVLSPSWWIQDMLAAEGVPSTLFHQGYDSAVFHPAPRRRSNDGQFYIFSGGKLEFRKGQDIVVDAFRTFRETPEGKDAILVTAWQNLWPQTMEGIWSTGYVKGIPAVRYSQKGPALDISAWLAANGVPAEAHIELGLSTQPELADAMRECDVAVFPNRAEGATLMPLVESLGVGLPVITGHWTGMADVMLPGVTWLFNKEAVTAPCSLYQSTSGWGEANPDDLVQSLIEHRNSIAPLYGPPVQWSWPTCSRKLHDLLTRFDG